MAKTKQPTVGTHEAHKAPQSDRTSSTFVGAGRRCGRSEPSGLARESARNVSIASHSSARFPRSRADLAGLFQGIEPLPLDHDLQARPCRRRARQRTKAFTSLLTTVIDNAL